VRWRRSDGGLPDDVRASLALRPRERVLTTARTRDGRWLAATEAALVGADLRIAWTDVAHAQWLDEESALVLDPVPGAFGSQRFTLADPGRLPETVHERVMASIVVSRRVAVPGGAVRVVGRSGDGGELVWQVVPERGVDLTDPAVRRAADVSVEALRRELGQ
jgi:hypothetical protein